MKISHFVFYVAIGSLLPFYGAHAMVLKKKLTFSPNLVAEQKNALYRMRQTLIKSTHENAQIMRHNKPKAKTYKLAHLAEKMRTPDQLLKPSFKIPRFRLGLDIKNKKSRFDVGIQCTSPWLRYIPKQRFSRDLDVGARVSDFLSLIKDYEFYNRSFPLIRCTYLVDTDDESAWFSEDDNEVEYDSDGSFVSARSQFSSSDSDDDISL